MAVIACHDKLTGERREERGRSRDRGIGHSSGAGGVWVNCGQTFVANSSLREKRGLWKWNKTEIFWLEHVTFFGTVGDRHKTFKFRGNRNLNFWGNDVSFFNFSKT